MTMTELPGRRSPDISWDDLVADVKALADQVPKAPDIIIPIVRGGLVPGCMLAYLLDVRDIVSISVEKQGEKRKAIMDVTEGLMGKSVLLIEDVTETRRSLLAAIDLLVSQGANVTTACLYTTPKSEIKPDYFLRMVQTIPKFPYEKRA